MVRWGAGGRKKRKERKSGERKGGDGRVVHHRPVSRRQSSPDNSLSPVMWSRPPVDAISKQLDTCSSVIVVVVTVSRRRSVKSHKKLFCSVSPRRKRRRLLKQRESRVQAVDRVQQGASHILSRDHRDAAAATESPGRPTDAGLLDVGLFYRHTHTDSLSSTTTRLCWVGPGGRNTGRTWSRREGLQDV